MKDKKEEKKYSIHQELLRTKFFIIFKWCLRNSKGNIVWQITFEHILRKHLVSRKNQRVEIFPI